MYKANEARGIRHSVPTEKNMFYEKSQGETTRSTNINSGNLCTNQVGSHTILGESLCPAGSQFPNCKMGPKSPFLLAPLPGLGTMVQILGQIADL